MKSINHISWLFVLLLLLLSPLGCSDDTSAGSEEGTETALETGAETGLPGDEVGTEVGTEVGDETTICTPDCENKNCGADGCGGICGNCPLGSICDDKSGTCQCLPNCEGKGCG